MRVWIAYIALMAVLLAAVFGFLTSISLKFFARELPYTKALLVSLTASVVGTFLMVLYYFVKARAGIANTMDSIAGFAMLAIMGTMVTKLAANYGVEKTGRLGVGAKSMFGLLVLMWIPALIVLAASYFT